MLCVGIELGSIYIYIIDAHLVNIADFGIKIRTSCIGCCVTCKIIITCKREILEYIQSCEHYPMVTMHFPSRIC